MGTVSQQRSFFFSQNGIGVVDWVGNAFVVEQFKKLFHKKVFAIVQQRSEGLFVCAPVPRPSATEREGVLERNVGKDVAVDFVNAFCFECLYKGRHVVTAEARVESGNNVEVAQKCRIAYFTGTVEFG